MFRIVEFVPRSVRSPLVLAGLLAAAVLSACSDLRDPSAPSIAPTQPAKLTTATGPVISVGPVVDFGKQALNTSSATKSIVIFNTGDADLTIGTIYWGGAMGDFDVLEGSCYNGPVSPGGSCTIDLIFKPTILGQRNGSANISSNAGAALATFTGEGIAANPGVLSVSATTLAYGSVDIGKTSAHQDVMIENTGSGLLTLKSAVLSGAGATDFLPVSTTGDCVLQAPMAPGARCSFSYAFAPVAAGARSATLEIDSDGGKKSVTLEGTGVQPTVYADVALSLGANPTTARSASRSRTRSR